MAPAESSATFSHSGFFVLRAPLLPFEALGSRLEPIVERPAVREAIFVASPSLDAEIDGSQPSPGGKVSRKVALALRRYTARMAGRATPFGLFAGCSVGQVGRATRLTVGEPSGRHTRLDMDYVVLLADALSRDPALRPFLRFFPNSSLYRIAGRARYQEVRRKDQGWTHHRATIQVPDYLEAVLARAADGATPGELAQALLDHDPEATESEAAEYVAELIAQQALVSELAPAVTGTEPVHRLIERLREVPAAALAVERLSWVRDELAEIDAGGLGAAPGRYRAIAARLADLPAEADVSRLFQVDLVRPPGATLGENVVAEIVRGVELLRRLTPRPAVDPLAAFRRAFMARFGDTPVTRVIPLAEALDDESGVAFADGVAAFEASSLLEGVDVFPEAENRVVWGARETHLLARLTETLARGEQELSLTEQDVEQLAVADPLPLPDAFAAMVRLEAASDQAVARGDFKMFLAGAGGPSGARLLGRFCNGDPELADCVARHLRSEESLRPDIAFAEIVHLPAGRVGNILARPSQRAYEIPYLGRSGAPSARQIPLSDLLVSLEGGRVVLRSARLGREVAPRLTSAHDFSASHGVYGFLCALQGQGVASGLGWDWGALAGSAFLPRVTFGRLVLARARWRVTEAEAALLAAKSEDPLAAVRRWRDARRLPRWVCIAEADNELPIDLEDPLMVETLLCRLRARQGAALVELFPSPDRLCAAGADGRYTHEIILPLVKRVDVPARLEGAPGERVAESVPAATCRRVFPPGSDWLSLKLYAGNLVVDRLVRDVVGPVANEFVAEGAAKRWFFVRYADPHGHLRLRFAGPASSLWSEVLPRVQAAVAPLVESGLVWKVQLDTYEREVERYGGPSGIEACEELFHLDSRAAVEVLGLEDDDPRGDRRWRATFLGADALLNDLGFDLRTKLALMARVRHGLWTDFTAGGARLERVGAKFRAEAAGLEEILAAREGSRWHAERATFERRSQDGAFAATALRRAAARLQLSSSLPDLAASLLHMHCNRMLRSAHRLQELVLYDFLHRFYEGQHARLEASLVREASAVPSPTGAG